MTSFINSLKFGNLVKNLKSGKTDLYELLDELCERIDNLEPEIHSLLPEANRRKRLFSEAELLLEKFPEKENRPPLFGIPVGIKDMFIVEGFDTYAGSRLPPEVFGGKESAVASSLKSAGAIILGKTVTTEFAYFAPGPTRNPHNIQHTPGGSSSGSAAAVAAGICPLATGTQTIGSITRPASFCGIFGYKPSYDRISCEGIIPFAPSIDHAGFFAQDMEGLSVAASLCAKNWRKEVFRDIKPALGVPEGPYLKQASDKAMAAFENSLSQLSRSGFKIKKIPCFGNIAEINKKHRIIAAAEMALVHQKWYSQYGTLYHSKTRDLIETGMKISKQELQAALEGRFILRKDLESGMHHSEVDLWITPGAPGPAPEGIESTGDPVMNLPWTHAGLPTLAIPDTMDENGMPIGLQFAARFDMDEELAAWGKMLETALMQ